MISCELERHKDLALMWFDRNQESAAINILVGRYWLASSKVARKAGHFQAAYSALLQGREKGAPYYFIQGCKLLYSSGESIRALQELNNALALTGDLDSSDVIDLTDDDEESLEIRRNKAKVRYKSRKTHILIAFRHVSCEQDGCKDQEDFQEPNSTPNSNMLHGSMESESIT